MTTRGQALDFFRDHVLGTPERPPGSNHAPPITDDFWDDSWCCMGISYVLTNVGIPLHMALVQNVINMAKAGKDGWSWQSDPLPGDCPCYEWGDGGIADHIGMLEAVRDDGRLIVLECNTRYNDARRMVREWDSTVLGFARPPYVDAPVTAPAPPAPPPLPKGVTLFTFSFGGDIFLADLGSQKMIHLSPEDWNDIRNPPPHIEITDDTFPRYFTLLKV